MVAQTAPFRVCGRPRPATTRAPPKQKQKKQQQKQKNNAFTPGPAAPGRLRVLAPRGVRPHGIRPDGRMR
eukprot:371217-Lingulodinium_polyedra.AAC.1